MTQTMLRREKGSLAASMREIICICIIRNKLRKSIIMICSPIKRSKRISPNSLSKAQI